MQVENVKNAAEVLRQAAELAGKAAEMSAQGMPTETVEELMKKAGCFASKASGMLTEKEPELSRQHKTSALGRLAGGVIAVAVALYMVPEWRRSVFSAALHELTQLTTYCLNVLSCTDELRGNENLKDAYEQAKTLEGSIRKLKIASLMEKRTLICVSGMQGAGKTTMIKNFYGLKTENLNICLGRGERIPVMITEKDIQEPLMQASVIERGENGTYTVTDREMEPEEFAKASAGGDGSILYLELCVPYRHLNNSGVSFVLLPGFEKKNDYWKTLIEFAVNSSDAAIFVFDESSFSQADNYEQLRQLKDRFGENIIYAITRSDSSAEPGGPCGVHRPVRGSG